jgi:hypothetical protein
MPRLRGPVPRSRRQARPQILYAAPRSARPGIESISLRCVTERDRSFSYFLLGCDEAVALKRVFSESLQVGF